VAGDRDGLALELAEFVDLGAVLDEQGELVRFQDRGLADDLQVRAVQELIVQVGEGCVIRKMFRNIGTQAVK
jgi:hypothetical protein